MTAPSPDQMRTQAQALLGALPGKVDCGIKLNWPCDDQVTLCWWDITGEQIEREKLHPLDGMDYCILTDLGDGDITHPFWKLAEEAIPLARQVVALADALAEREAELKRVREALELLRDCDTELDDLMRRVRRLAQDAPDDDTTDADALRRRIAALTAQAPASAERRCEMRVYFFGCESRSNIGHYLYVRPGRDDWGEMQEIVAGLGGVHLDTGLLKKAGVPDSVGQGVYVQQGGYSIVSWWDRGGDPRGASNSAFIVEGDCSPQDVMRLGREAFPTIANRSRVTLPDGTQLS